MKLSGAGNHKSSRLRMMTLLRVGFLALATGIAATASAAPESAGFQNLPRRNWFKRLFFKPSWEQALAECRTPREVCRMVERHVAYREETVDRWTAARDTWQRGAGDCEDFAACVQFMCRELGLGDVTIRLFYPLAAISAGHAVAIGQTERGFWLSSNGSYEECDTLADVEARVARILWCERDKMWSVALADEDVSRLIAGAATLTPVATGSAP